MNWRFCFAEKRFRGDKVTEISAAENQGSLYFFSPDVAVNF